MGIWVRDPVEEGKRKMMVKMMRMTRTMMEMTWDMDMVMDVGRVGKGRDMILKRR